MIRLTAAGKEDLLPQREVYRYKTSSAAELKDRRAEPSLKRFPERLAGYLQQQPTPSHMNGVIARLHGHTENPGPPLCADVPLGRTLNPKLLPNGRR
ncbi:hypothetical protein EYF80_048550 [Liparis tanakae]|uniref:Uncharacterized protein n=1 Tax=Liparis tanakae TaxID=230148 RepID=A0A4Z2FJY6_9TELE|nr:hypothetical protein EYF80_048550 [Liparis tanakae]